MKKILSLTLVFIILTTTQPLSYCQSNTSIPTYEGLTIYKELFNNINFQDINKNWAKPYINRMSALSIIKGMGDKSFNPKGTLTKEQAIALLVRLMGLEEDAQIAGEASKKNSDTGGYQILSSYDHWIRGYIETAQNNNIITQEEIDKITSLDEAEQENIDIKLENKMLPYEKDFNLTENQLTEIEKQLREKLERNFTWGQAVDREQVSIWVARIMELEPINGENQQNIYNLKDWKEIKTENVPIIEAVLQAGIMEGNTNREFRPKDRLTRGQMAKILDNISEEFLIKRGYTIHQGIVEKIDDTVDVEINPSTNKEVYVKKKIFQVKNDDNTLVNILTQESEDGSYDKGFVAYKDNKLTLPSSIEVLDYIKYFIDSQGNVVLVETLDEMQITIEGFIEDINLEDNMVSIADYKDMNYKFEVIPGAEIKVNDQYAQLKDLLYGQEVEVWLRNGKITNIVGYLDMGEEGYIYPGDRVYMGKVLYVDSNNKLTIMEEDNKFEFSIDDYIPVIKEDKNIGFNGIREGDIVRLEFDQYNGNRPIKVYISKEDKQLANLFKATIDDTNLSRGQLILSDVSYYEHTKWKDKVEKMNLPLGYYSEIYLNGRKIPKELLNNYLNMEAYIATESNFGKEEAFKIILKTGYETKYHDSIQKLAFGDKKLNVDYNELTFDYDSTIVIKDGRLVHPYNLMKDDDIFAVAYGTDNKVASFISVENVPSTGLIVYRGRIDEITQYGFELDNFNIFEDNVWDYESKQTAFVISDDTKIIDTREKVVKKVEVEDFTNSRFLKDKYSDESYYGEYTYAVEYNNMMVALNIIDSSSKAQVVSTADIQEIDSKANKIQIKNINDWNDFEEKWNINSSKINLRVEDAIFIKNGKPVDINDLSSDDSLYVLRKNDVGVIVIVR